MRSAPISLPWMSVIAFGQSSLELEASNLKSSSTHVLAFAKTPMRTPMASYSLFILSFVIFVEASPVVKLPSSLVLNFANGNNTSPRLPSNTTNLINDTLDMNTVWAESQPFI